MPARLGDDDCRNRESASPATIVIRRVHVRHVDTRIVWASSSPVCPSSSLSMETLAVRSALRWTGAAGLPDRDTTPLTGCCIRHGEVVFQHQDDGVVDTPISPASLTLMVTFVGPTVRRTAPAADGDTAGRRHRRRFRRRRPYRQACSEAFVRPSSVGSGVSVARRVGNAGSSRWCPAAWETPGSHDHRRKYSHDRR